MYCTDLGWWWQYPPRSVPPYNYYVYGKVTLRYINLSLLHRLLLFFYPPRCGSWADLYLSIFLSHWSLCFWYISSLYYHSFGMSLFWSLYLLVPHLDSCSFVLSLCFLLFLSSISRFSSACLSVSLSPCLVLIFVLLCSHSPFPSFVPHSSPSLYFLYFILFPVPGHLLPSPTKLPPLPFCPLPAVLPPTTSRCVYYPILHSHVLTCSIFLHSLTPQPHSSAKNPSLYLPPQKKMHNSMNLRLFLMTCLFLAFLLNSSCVSIPFFMCS